jgi:hypothetical protein
MDGTILMPLGNGLSTKSAFNAAAALVVQCRGGARRAAKIACVHSRLRKRFLGGASRDVARACVAAADEPSRWFWRLIHPGR